MKPAGTDFISHDGNNRWVLAGTFTELPFQGERFVSSCAPSAQQATVKTANLDFQKKPGFKEYYLID